MARDEAQIEDGERDGKVSKRSRKSEPIIRKRTDEYEEDIGRNESR